MPIYKYTAINRSGKKIKGIKESISEEDLKIILRREKLLLKEAIELKEKEKKGSRFQVVKGKDVAIMTRELSAMLDGGISLLRAITILSKQDKKKGLKDSLTAIREDLIAGLPLSEALEKHPKYFNKLYINMVKSGEESGSLDIIMERLAGALERSEEIKGKVRGALIYPVVVFSLTIGIIFLLVAFVLPTFVSIFEGTGTEIPALTAAVITMSLWTNRYWYVIILGIVGVSFIFKKVIKTKKGKVAWDRLKLKLPLFSNVIKKTINARFTRIMATLLDSGVPILKSFDIVSEAVGNVVIGEAILTVKKEIEAGETIAKPLEDQGVFPDMLVNMVDVGEESGNLVGMLNKIADFNERELEEAIRDMLAMFEPIIILVLGVVVGVLIIAMYLPIFGLADALG